MIQTSQFQEALNTIEALPLDDQAELLNILHNRLKLRQQVIQEVQEVRQEYQEGIVRFGSINDFLLELDD
jgi:hypothetical protein